jgi:hypothetical protein
MRGQLFSFDFIFALSLIVFLFALSLFVSGSISTSINNSEQQRELKISAAFALSALLETPGNPSNWDYLQFTDTNVKAIGLSSKKNVLEKHKVEQFFTLANSGVSNYNQLKGMIGLNLPSTNFALTISSLNGTLFDTFIQPPKNASIYSQQRIGMLNDQVVTIKLRVWVER